MHEFNICGIIGVIQNQSKQTGVCLFMNTNWKISDVKRRGKATFKASYWKCVLVAFIISLLGGGVSAGNSFSSVGTNSFNADNYVNEDGSYNFSAILGIDSDYDNKIGELAEEIASSPNFGIILATFIGIFAFAMIISIALSIFLLTPLDTGCKKFFTEAGKTRRYELGNIVYAFNSNYMNVVKIMFLMNLKIFLWTLLFIIPGIIKTYEYLMIPYIVAENPNISSDEAFSRSRELMTGNKWHAFLLGLSFIGWIFLSLLLCGIPLIFYVAPYIAATDAELYLTLKGDIREWGTDQGGYHAPYGSPYGGNQYGGSPYGGNQYGNPKYNGGAAGSGSYGKTSYGSGNMGYGNPANNATKDQTGGSSYGQSMYDEHPQDFSSNTGYTDGEYRELNASDDTGDKAPVSNNGDTPAFGDKRNNMPNNDKPFNTPY